MISNSFLPASNPCVRRTVGFIRLLRNYGWEPVLLTREAAAADISDEPADLEIPEGMDVYRTNPWELDELPGILGRAGRRLGEWLLAPDKERLWEIFSCRKAAKIVKYDGIDLIYTASPPKSSHLLGLYLKKRFPQIPWIADISAEYPADTGNAGIFRNSFRAGSEKKADRRICEAADCIITGTGDILNEIPENASGKSMRERCFNIPDGSVEELSGVFEKSCRHIAAKRLAI